MQKDSYMLRNPAVVGIQQEIISPTLDLSRSSLLRSPRPWHCRYKSFPKFTGFNQKYRRRLVILTVTQSTSLFEKKSQETQKAKLFFQKREKMPPMFLCCHCCPLLLEMISRSEGPKMPVICAQKKEKKYTRILLVQKFILLL